MNLDDLKAGWQQRHNDLGKDRVGDLAADVVARTASLEAKIWRRDVVEAVAAVIVLCAFGAFLWFGPPMPVVMKIGVVIIMLSAIEIVVVMHWARRRDAEPNQDAPFVEFCATEKVRLDRQIHLLRNITWWYSGPLLLGCCVMMFGVLSSVRELPALIFYGFHAAFYACFLAVGIILYRHNARAADGLVAFRDELVEIVRSVEGPYGN